MRVPRNRVEAAIKFAGLKMLFIHTPKCGGSFINRAFGKRHKACPSMTWKEARGHKTFLEYREIFKGRGENIYDYVLFTVVRNPWDWHLSWYNYVSKDVGAKKSGMLIEHEQIKNLTFSEYLRWLDDPEVIRSQDDYARKQVSDWIVDETGTLVSRHILRQETLEGDLNDLSEEFGLAINVPSGQRINASRNDVDYRRFYSSEEVEIIASRHQRDIELFGYKFE